MYINAMNNAAYTIQQNSNSLIRLAGSTPSDSPQNLALMLRKEKSLNADNEKNKLVYSASELMDDTYKKVKNENIKRSFSTFM